MPAKRVHVGFTEAQYKALQKLAVKWGLDVSSTIKHCIALKINEELQAKDRPQK